MVTRRRLLLGSAAAAGALGLGAAGATAWATRPTSPAAAAGAGLPLPNGTTLPVDYRSRSAWSANESWRDWPSGPEEWEADHTSYQKKKYTRYPVQTITVHHTAGDNTPPSGGWPAELRSIYNYQCNTRGWGDIGYNLLIDPNGVVYEGRYSIGHPWPIFGPETGIVPLMTTGAHVGGYNSGNMGICVLGNFDGGHGPTDAAIDALVAVIAALCRFCRIDPLATVSYLNPVPAADPNNGDYADQPLHYAQRTVRAISGHRNWASTACPGANLYPLLPEIRSAAAALIPPPSPRPRPTATIATPGDVGRDYPTPSGPPPGPGVPPGRPVPTQPPLP